MLEVEALSPVEATVLACFVGIVVVMLMALIASMRSALPLLLRVAEAADRMTPGADDWHWSDSMRDELHAAVRALRSEP